MDSQNPFREKLPFLLEHLYLKFVLFYQTLWHGPLVREAQEFAGTLEDLVFPELQKIDQPQITVQISNDKKFILADLPSNTPYKEIEKTDNMNRFLAQIGIRTIVIDTLLEASQIVNIFKLIFHSGEQFNKTLIIQKDQKACNNKSLAAMLISAAGLNKFGVNIRFDTKSKTLTLQYYYCELFYSFMVHTVLKRYTKTKNHLAIFALAPKTGLVVGLLFLLHHLFWSPYSATGVTAALLGAMGLGFGLTFLVNTLASLLYDQEHRDK